MGNVIRASNLVLRITSAGDAASHKTTVNGDVDARDESTVVEDVASHGGKDLDIVDAKPCKTPVSITSTMARLC